MAKFPLGGTSRDYNSKKSVSTVVNLIPEKDKSGAYRVIRKAEGLTLLATLPTLPVRSDPLVNAGFVYLVSGDILYRIDSDGAFTSLGTVGGSGRAKLEDNAVPGDSQILILNGSGVGFIFDDANGLVEITDVDFFASSSVTVLEERFWLSRDDSNEFFGSDLSNGNSYNPLTFGSADESSDKVIAVIAKKSALWVLGSDTIQYFQTFNSTTFPLRTVKGSTKEWGILAVDSLSEINDFFAFLASDRTVRMVQGTQLIEISDLDFQLKVKGNGTPDFPGFTTVSDAYGFFVNGPVHSTYYITFPTEGYTWGYDVKTGLTHTRESEGVGYWRVNGAVKFGLKIICGDNITGQVWVLDPDKVSENGSIFRTKLVTPSISFENNVTIPLIELDMEVAQTTDPTADPKMIVYYTKNGGKTWTHKGHVSLGKFGDHKKRVPLRKFGRLVRLKDFALRLETTDNIGVRYYGAKIITNESL